MDNMNVANNAYWTHPKYNITPGLNSKLLHSMQVHKLYIQSAV